MWSAIVVVALAVGGVSGYLWLSGGGQREVVLELGGHRVTIPASAAAAPRVPKVIYLERRGATLFGGEDVAHENRSSVVHSYGKTQVVVPAFSSTDKRWKQIVTCVQKQFTPFDVVVTDVRPTEPGYVLAVFGGKPSLLGADKKVAGLAPFNGGIVPDAVVLVFTQALGNRAQSVCEVAAMEIAHVYGLDHELTCKDPMGYKTGCGARWFRDEDFPCGEQAARECADGHLMQNSVQRLGAALGFKDGRTPRVPPPVSGGAKPQTTASQPASDGHMHQH
jgi:hypothetical protein